MSRKDKALRATAEFLIALQAKTKDTEVRQAIKSHADLCCLALPMSKRFTRDELAKLRG